MVSNQPIVKICTNCHREYTLEQFLDLPLCYSGVPSVSYDGINTNHFRNCVCGPNGEAYTLVIETAPDRSVNP